MSLRRNLGSLLAVCLLAAVTAGCATEEPFVNPLNVAERGGIHIAEIEVRKTGGESSQTLAGKLKTAIEAYFADTPNGARPIRMGVTIDDYAINHFMQAVLIGGADRLSGTVVLVDTADDTLIATDHVSKTVQEQGWLGALVNAVADDEERLSDGFAEILREKFDT